MKDRAQKIGAVQTAAEPDLTRSIRNLSAMNGYPGNTEEGEDESHSALLIVRDNASQKWGPRWLKQTDLNTTLITDPEDGLSKARTMQPDVIIVETGLHDQHGARLIQVFQDAADLAIPVIALCSNAKEVLAAADACVFDVVRKPVEWQLTSRRALHAAQFGAREKQLQSARESLSAALELAEGARLHLRSRESFEPITGLPNKSQFMNLLTCGMNAAERDSNILAVFVIGFNRFRLIVEAMGQETADLVMVEIGERLSKCLEDAGSVQVHTTGLRTAAAAKIDSTLFGLMLTCSEDSDELSALRQRLTDELSRPVRVAGQSISVSSCIGATLYPRDANDVDSLLQRADNAMRDAQSRGGGFRFYCEETDAAAARKLKIEHMLYEAFDRSELRLAYQPLVDVSSGQIIGAEALLRWKQPDGSFVSPSEFVPVAEESGLMIRIGEFVLNEACQQLKSWQLEGFSSLRMSVNVAKCQLMSGCFVEVVQDILKKHELRPGDLDLELSERGVLSGDYDVISQLHELKRLGVRLAIDDFGSGDAAISYLKELPIDKMKIDCSYIAGLMDNGKLAALASGMIALGQRLDLTVVAEGVESPEQLAALQKLGCDHYQGFYLSPAVPSEKFAKLMRKSEKQ